MLWKNDRSEYGYVRNEKVQVYECEFSTSKSHPQSVKIHKVVIKVLVVCDTVEEAIAACRQQWPDEFVLHQVVKRNQRCDLIVVDSVLKSAEPSVVRQAPD